VAVIAVILLVLAVAGAITRPWGVPAWVAPVATATVAVALRVLPPGDAWDAVQPLRAPVAFLLLAVPLAAMLNRLGVFAAAAHLASGRHLCAGMWILGALVVAVLNLDAAVVLWTPLAITVARRWGIDPVALAFQPALLACLASSVLTVSNLTNLIAVSAGRLTAGELITRLGPTSVASCVVGYAGWRLAFRGRPLTPSPAGTDEPVSKRALAIGAVVFGALLVGFLVGRLVGVEPWLVVAVVDVAVVMTGGRFAWRAIPWGTAAVAIGLAIVAAAAAQRTAIADVLVAAGTWPQALRGALGANVLNNLPAFLLALPRVSGPGPATALLFGVNAGPTILVTGSLSGLLWLDAARRNGLDVGPRDYARVGLIAGVPALLAGIAVLSTIAN
jgi:arsenical pump membrane protein